MSDVLYRATKYMNVEDALLTREEKPRKRERQEDARQDMGQKMARIRPTLQTLHWEICKFHIADGLDRPGLNADKRRRSSDVSW